MTSTDPGAAGAAQERPHAEQKCATCGKPATCLGAYEGHEGPPQYACDACCAHGNEDGWCKPVDRAERPHAEKPEAAKPLSARWQELFWALPPGEMRHKLRALEIDTGRAITGASLVADLASALKGLQEKWQAEAAVNRTALEQLADDDPDDGEDLLARWNAYRKCADDLSALLARVDSLRVPPGT